ncbi:MAG: MFS transporter [Isosphaeraceae bacterium]
METDLRSPSTRSLIGLDALNFFLADVRDGLGPYLAIYLASQRHWEADRIGWAMAAMLIGTVAAQTPLGWLVDRIRMKRLAVAIAAGAVAIGCILMILMPTYPVILSAQGASAAGAALPGPAIAALTLGLVGHRMLARQAGRNEAFNHAGNVVSALLLAGGPATSSAMERSSTWSRRWRRRAPCRSASSASRRSTTISPGGRRKSRGTLHRGAPRLDLRPPDPKFVAASSLPLRQRRDAAAGRREGDRGDASGGVGPDVGLHHRGPDGHGAGRPGRAATPSPGAGSRSS